MTLHAWRSLVFLTLTSLQLTSSQQFVFDNQLTSDEESVCLSRSGGYYADLASDCSSYTLCGPGGREFEFACPPGTRFHQKFLVCNHAYQVDCPESPRFYRLNELIGRVEEVSEPAEQPKRTTPARSLQFQSALQRPRNDPRPPFQRSSVPSFNASATRRTPQSIQPQRPAVSRQALPAPPPAVPAPSAAVRALPAADVGQTLLDLVQISTRESNRRPAASRGQQRPRVAGVEPRSRQVSPVVPSILTQVAALGRPGITQVAPPRRPGLTQEAPLRRQSSGRLTEPTNRGTFFPARPERPRQDLRPATNRLERLNKSLSSPLAANAPVRPRPSARKIRFPARKTRPEAPLRSGAGRRQGVRSAVGGWRTVSRMAPGADLRCPRCLAALVTDWDDCFPCVSVLR